MHHAFKLRDTEYNVELSRAADGYRLHIGDRVVPMDVQAGADGRTWLTLDGEHHEVVVATRGDEVFVHVDGEAFELRYEHPLKRLAAALGGNAADSVTAPMPGSLVAVHVKTGDAVKLGQTLLVMESMKMETAIVAPRDGAVKEVHFAPGQTFDRDVTLLTLEPEAK